MTLETSAGLCEHCRHARRIPAARSTFVLCARGLSDPAYPKYPVLPVRRCAGVEPLPVAPAPEES